MDHGPVADGHIGADAHGLAGIAVQHGTVLHVTAFAHMDRADPLPRATAVGQRLAPAASSTSPITTDEATQAAVSMRGLAMAAGQ